MQVRAGGTPASAFVADHIATLHVHSYLSVEIRKVAVPGGDAESVIDYDKFAIPRAPIDYRDYPVS